MHHYQNVYTTAVVVVVIVLKSLLVSNPCRYVFFWAWFSFYSVNSKILQILIQTIKCLSCVPLIHVLTFGHNRY